MTPAPANPKLPGAGKIHLWHLPADTKQFADFCAAGQALLSADESERLSGMKQPVRAKRYLAGRILIRRVLGRYLSQDPAMIELNSSANGKLSLGGAGLKPAFSLSHAADETVLAVAGSGDIGVDIEQLSRAPVVERIARSFFSPAENRYLDGRCGDRAETALTLWTLKEAIVKARGDTVWDGLAGISLSIDGGHIGWNSSPGCWRLAAGGLGASQVLAVAHRGPEDDGKTLLVFRHYDAVGNPVPERRFTPVFTG